MKYVLTLATLAVTSLVLVTASALAARGPNITCIRQVMTDTETRHREWHTQYSPSPSTAHTQFHSRLTLEKVTRLQVCMQCGNGRRDNGEQCDDGNFGDSDGCSAQCKTECHPPSDGCNTCGCVIDDQTGMVTGYICTQNFCEQPLPAAEGAPAQPL